MQFVDGSLGHMKNDHAGRIRFAFREELVLVRSELDFRVGDRGAVGDAAREEDDAAGRVGNCCRDQREIGEHERTGFGFPVVVVAPIGFPVVSDFQNVVSRRGGKESRSIGIVNHEDVVDVEQMVDGFVPGIGKCDGLIANQEHFGGIRLTVVVVIPVRGGHVVEVVVKRAVEPDIEFPDIPGREGEFDRFRRDGEHAALRKERKFLRQVRHSIIKDDVVFERGFAGTVRQTFFHADAILDAGLESAVDADGGSVKCKRGIRNRGAELHSIVRKIAVKGRWRIQMDHQNITVPVVARGMKCDGVFLRVGRGFG